MNLFRWGKGTVPKRFTALRQESERRHAEILDTVRSTANVQVPFNVQGVGVPPPYPRPTIILTF
ncbi:hypothetical protein BC826DRAFT_1025253 [Russula brevipes]|nr:hypothetical protein BC826DRAFT_1025253 [Russula brevipes]